MELAGKLALVTGASSGIGAATARVLAAEGAHVLLLARDEQRLQHVVEQVRAQGGAAHAFVVNMSSPDAIASVAQTLTCTHGPPDILVNNAGAGRWLPILATSAEEARQMMAVPYLAAFNITRELLPGMLARGSGHIVNVTSVAARLAWPGAVAYAAARSAMEGFTNALRADLHGSPIGVTLAMFGTVESPYWEHNPGSRERLPRRAASMPVLSPDRAAALIATGIERERRTIVAPGVYVWLFLLNSILPGWMDAAMADGRTSPRTRIGR